MMTNLLFRYAGWGFGAVLLLPLLVFGHTHWRKHQVAAQAEAMHQALCRITGEQAEVKCLVWYLPGCRPCVEELPLLYRLDSIGRATGAFSVTCLAEADTARLPDDKVWRQMRLRKVTVAEGAAFVPSPQQFVQGRAEVPAAFPTYLVVRRGKLVRYRTGAATTMDDLLP